VPWPADRYCSDGLPGKTAEVLSRQPRNSVRRRFVAATGLVLAVAGLLTACGGDPGPRGAMPVADGFSDQAPPTNSTQSRPKPESRQVVPQVADELSPQLADPESVSIPALHISAKLQPLHLDAKGVLVPPDYGIAGWYAAGPEPGERGPAVIAGHVDSKVGPDTFFRLGQARPGQRIWVGLKDGTKLVFRVTEIKEFSKDNFPTKRVYGDTKDPELRMITCAGDFDHAAGHYKDNLVVFADLAT
jgi:sortase (surface protein transpeptidase)